MTERDANQIHWPRCLGWAVFLGCSWTWCIGMFLPVLLVRDFGVAGWIVFAIPNVLGAAAMGWVLRSAESSRTIVEKHASACVAFSIVTVLFHIFFLEWIVGQLVGQTVLLAYVLAYVGYLVARRASAAHLLAAVVLLVSAGAFVAAYQHSGSWTARPMMQTRSAAAVAWLAPVSIFGFAFSPYLDLTFHRARQASGPGEARAAFGIGFGVFFMAMILFSLWYAPGLERWMQSHGREGMGLFAAAIGIHMLVQSAFTMSAHLTSVATLWEAESEKRKTKSDTRDRFSSFAFGFSPLTGWTIGLLALVLIVAATFINDLEGAGGYHGVEWGEIVYRAFMGFYGLAFPAYVWLCMLPFGGAGASRRALRVFAIAVAAAAPMYWMGFIEGKMIWLVPGVGLVLLARVLVGGKSKLIRPEEGRVALHENPHPAPLPEYREKA